MPLPRKPPAPSPSTVGAASLPTDYKTLQRDSEAAWLADAAALRNEPRYLALLGEWQLIQQPIQPLTTTQEAQAARSRSLGGAAELGNLDLDGDGYPDWWYGGTGLSLTQQLAAAAREAEAARARGLVTERPVQRVGPSPLPPSVSTAPPCGISTTVPPSYLPSANTSRARRTLADTENVWQRLGAHKHTSRAHWPLATRAARASTASFSAPPHRCTPPTR